MDCMAPTGRKTSVLYGLNHVPRPVPILVETHNQRCVTAWMHHRRSDPPARLPPVKCTLRPGTLKSLPPNPPTLFFTRDQAIARRELATSQATRFAAHTKQRCARWRAPRKSPRGGYANDKRVLESHGVLLSRHQSREHGLRSPSALTGTVVEDTKAAMERHLQLLQARPPRGATRDHGREQAASAFKSFGEHFSAEVLCVGIEGEYKRVYELLKGYVEHNVNQMPEELKRQHQISVDELGALRASGCAESQAVWEGMCAGCDEELRELAEEEGRVKEELREAKFDVGVSQIANEDVHRKNLDLAERCHRHMDQVID